MGFINGCTPQYMNGLNKHIKIKMPSKSTRKSSSKYHTSTNRYYPTPKKSCRYYANKYGKYSIPANTCRNMIYSRPDCLISEKRWNGNPNIAQVKSCRSRYKHDIWTLSAYK